MPQLLSTSDLRVDVGGTPALDGLSLATTGERALILGGARALFEATAGLRRARRGEVFVEGMTPRAAIRAGVLACAPLDPPLPARWTIEQYVQWSARLAGHARAEARAEAADALDRLQLTSSARSRLGAASPSLRRATVLAGALATAAPVLVIDDPLSSLPLETSRPLSRIVARALTDRRTILFAARIALESPLALAADEALVIDRSDVVAQGTPAELAPAERSLALRVDGDVAAFAAAIERLGARVTGLSDAPPPVHLRVELGLVPARDLLRAAADVHAIVVELRPISRAFA